MPIMTDFRLQCLIQYIPVLQSSNGTPEHSLSSTSCITIRVEEGDRGSSILSSAYSPAGLKPSANPRDKQEKHSRQDETQVEAWQEQRPQQSASNTWQGRKEFWLTVSGRTIKPALK